jgi:hypothetical protein
MIINFVFKAPDHLRYENGKHVSGPNGGAAQAVQVEPNVNRSEGYNIQGGEGYIVTVFNLDGNHPVWNSKVQMTPKPMKIISQSSEKIVLRGYEQFLNNNKRLLKEKSGFNGLNSSKNINTSPKKTIEDIEKKMKKDILGKVNNEAIKT